MILYAHNEFMKTNLTEKIASLQVLNETLCGLSALKDAKGDIHYQFNDAIKSTANGITSLATAIAKANAEDSE